MDARTFLDWLMQLYMEASPDPKRSDVKMSFEDVQFPGINNAFESSKCLLK